MTRATKVKVISKCILLSKIYSEVFLILFDSFILKLGFIPLILRLSYGLRFIKL